MRNSSDMAAPNDTGSNGDGSIATDGGSEPDPAPYVKPGPWAQMTTEERHAFMEHVVEPEMRELFVAFDSEEFADFGCETCHGENADEVEYDMPNTVTALSLDDFPLTNSSDPRIREFAVFMDDEVKPQMAAFLDRTPRPQGDFGCLACHGRL
jgi:hypothetical protein